jgi:hypothetical protein
MTTSAAAIRIGSPANDDWKAWALPWNVVARDAGLPACCSIYRIAATASPSATPGFKLNEIMVEGNIP